MAAEEAFIIKPTVKIKVFGVGGGGNNVLIRLGQHNDLDIDLIAVNTDAMQLKLAAQAGIKTIQIGENLTRGRGTGGNVAVGEQAALEAKSELEDAVSGADLVFVTAAMGGGAGTGAAPVIAEIAAEAGVLSVGVVTLPFAYEGSRKKRTAIGGIQKMQAQMDALIAVENDNLLKLPENRRMSMKQAFLCADDILRQAINCIAELILTTGVINVDFADVTTIFRQNPSSDALLGIGRSARSAVDAVKNAVESPLLEKSLDGARGIIVNLTGDDSLSLYDVDEAMRYVHDHAKGEDEVNIILGTVVDNSMAGEVKATIIATDFRDSVAVRPAPKAAPEAEPQPGTRRDYLTPPSFMSGGEQTGAKRPAFAMPAFKLTPDDADKK